MGLMSVYLSRGLTRRPKDQRQQPEKDQKRAKCCTIPTPHPKVAPWAQDGNNKTLEHTHLPVH